MRGAGGESSQRTPDQRPFLSPVGGQIEFKKGVIRIVIAKEEPGVGERNDVRSVIFFSPIHLSKRYGSDRQFAGLRLRETRRARARRIGPRATGRDRDPERNKRRPGKKGDGGHTGRRSSSTP